MQSMNYSLANMEQQRSDAFEAAVEDLANVRLQALRQQSSVDAAVSEGIMGGGRTAALISRSMANDTARTAQSIKTNYSKRSNEIDLNKESQLLSTKQQIEALPKVHKPNALGTLLGVAGDYYNAKNTQDEINLKRKKANIDSNKTSTKIPDYDFYPWLGKDAFTNKLKYYNKAK